MNLGSILKGVVGLFLGGWSKDQYNGNPKNNEQEYTDIGGSLDNLGAKITGNRLTNAEREANAFSAGQAEAAFNREAAFSREMFDRETALANTAYQRQVEDMRRAGLNPMLALGAGGSASPSAASVSSAAPSSVSPGSANLGALLQLFSLPAQLKNIAADTKEKRANAESKEEQTRGDRMRNDFYEITRDLEFEGLKLENGLSEKRISELDQNIKESRSRVDKNIAETKESEERANLAVQQSVLANVTARNIEYMQPYLAQESASRSALNEAQMNAAIVDAAYRQKLINSGTIEAAVRASNASASESVVKAEVEKIEKMIKSKEFSSTPDPNSENVCEKIVSAIRIASRSIQGK